MFLMPCHSSILRALLLQLVYAFYWGWVNFIKRDCLLTSPHLIPLPLINNKGRGSGLPAAQGFGRRGDGLVDINYQIKLRYNRGTVIDVNVLTSGWTIAGVIASFCVAAIALWLGIKSNRQLYELRRLEKQEYLVNKIVDWAEGITVFVSKQIVEDRTNAKIILNDAAERLKELNVLAAEGEYIESLVSPIFPKRFTR